MKTELNIDTDGLTDEHQQAAIVAQAVADKFDGCAVDLGDVSGPTGPFSLRVHFTRRPKRFRDYPVAVYVEVVDDEGVAPILGVQVTVDVINVSVKAGATGRTDRWGLAVFAAQVQAAVDIAMEIEAGL